MNPYYLQEIKRTVDANGKERNCIPVGRSALVKAMLMWFGAVLLVFVVIV